MDKTTINEILELNAHFYESYAKEFSVTRAAPWPGWQNLVPFFSKLEQPSVVDLGCGNGRFLKFLHTNLNTPFHYTGLDISTNLINEAKVNFATETSEGMAKFTAGDILNSEFIDRQVKDCNFACGFGLMHHIPTPELRESFAKTVANKLETDGFLVLTFWTLKPEESKIVKDLGNNDYYMKWGTDDNNYRFVHFFTEEEVADFSAKMEQHGLKLVNKYKADGKSGDANLYVVWEKFS
jgi:tRNA (uracil-5-)-methyltransferase TRM9